MIGRNGLGEDLTAQVRTDGVRNDEITIRQSPASEQTPRGGWHHGQRSWPLPVHTDRARGHEFIVHPDTAHRVVHRRIDAHRHFIRIFVGDVVVHLEEFAITCFDHIATKALDGIGSPDKLPVLFYPHPVRRRRPLWPSGLEISRERGYRSWGIFSR